MSMDWGADRLQDLPKGGPSDSKAHQVQLLSGRANKLTQTGDIEGVITARKAAIALSPEDYVFDRFMLASVYGHLGRFDEAEKLFEEVYTFAPEIIVLLKNIQRTLMNLKRNEEAQKMTAPILELERIFREQ